MVVSFGGTKKSEKILKNIRLGLDNIIRMAYYTYVKGREVSFLQKMN